MLLIAIVIVVWALSLLLLSGLCMAAARGDAALVEPASFAPAAPARTAQNPVDVAVAA